MASGTAPPERAIGEPPALPSVGEQLIDQRLRQTRRQLAGVETADGLIVLAAGTLVFLLCFALADHWLISGGLGFGGRFLAFLGLLVGGGVVFARKILPLMVRRIHPLFAARTIEDAAPGMKNSLVNFLFLRGRPEEIGSDAISQRFYEGLEQRTAADLAAVDAHTAVDHGGVIRHGYVLAGVLAVLCLYLVLSPKSPLTSIRRAIWPWANVPAPTRVVVEEIMPGDTTAFQGDTLTVSAKIRELRDDEQALVYFTTADGQSVNQAVPMSLDEQGYRYRCELPPGASGLQQDLTYHLAAGDFRSPKFFVKVDTALAIPVEEIRYDYPDYTGLADRVTRQTGDVRAIEGTRLTVLAAANQPIDRAWIELLKSDGGQTAGRVTMDSQGTAATGRFTVRPEYEAYQICFRDTAGHENRRPVRYRIDVVADAPPAIRFVDPPPERAELPQNGAVELKVGANDDFGLRRVKLHFVRDNRSLQVPTLLEKLAPEKAHEGSFEGSHRFAPSESKLNVGDEIEYWAEAQDNRESNNTWAPNRSETTPRRRITIVAPEAGAEQPQEGQQQSEKNGQPQEGQQQSEKNGQQQEGQQQSEKNGQQQEGQQQQSDQSGQQQEGQQQSEQSGQQQEGQQQSDQSGQQQSEQSGQTGDQSDTSPPAASGGTGSEQKGDKQPNHGQPIDGQSNPGDAFDQILKHLNDQQKQTKPGQQPPGESPASGGSADQPSAQDQQPPENEQPAEDQGEPQPDASTSAPSPTQGESGGGRPSPDPQGTPSPQEANRPHDTAADRPDQSPSDTGSQPKSPSISPEQSDSQGDTAGERSGGGKEGGGQKSEQEGTGFAGTHTDAEQGSSQSEQEGQGETSDEAGDQVEADHATGRSEGQKQGPGSESRATPGSQGADDAPKAEAAPSSGTPSQPSQPAEKPGDSEAGTLDPNAQGPPSPSKMTGGGAPGQQTQQQTPELKGSDDVNLDYARQQTELALEYLDDQLAKEQPDRQLLDRLGWTRDDMEAFVRRWQAMRQAAGRSGSEGEASKRDLDEAVKSLGLRPPTTERKGGQTTPDEDRGLKDSGRHEPPPEWRDLFEAYTKSISSPEK